PKADPQRMVKEYQRPAAGKSDPRPSDLRPPGVLLSTVNYLIDEIVPKTDCNWSVVYEFVFDRMRAVRQDMVIQRIEGLPAIDILQKIIRFYFFAHYKMCTEPTNKFDPQINDTHLQECLKRLLVLYSDEEKKEEEERGEGNEGGGRRREQNSEFYALFLLHNLGHSDALLLGLQKKDRYRCCQIFIQCLTISLAWWQGNYARVLRLSKSLPALHCCAIHHHFNSIISAALLRMSCAFNSKTLCFPLKDVCSLFNLNNEHDTREICQNFGFSIGPKGVLFSKACFKSDYQVRFLLSLFIIVILNYPISDSLFALRFCG
ncbi:hypothetical protein CAPTEDRAFT_145958, partial [Capitella teleta]|uniref:SAC3/GANP/THP3 conserved domain-containing protein n=1 Tax=Capitella teleta TaxID=283909 RepID=X1Z4E9_CAPTE